MLTAQTIPFSFTEKGLLELANLGTAVIVALALLVFVIVFGGVAIFLIRRQNNDESQAEKERQSFLALLTRAVELSGLRDANIAIAGALEKSASAMEHNTTTLTAIDKRQLDYQKLLDSTITLLTAAVDNNTTTMGSKIDMLSTQVSEMLKFLETSQGEHGEIKKLLEGIQAAIDKRVTGEYGLVPSDNGDGKAEEMS